MPHEYWRETLERSEKKLYDSMVSAFSRYQQRVTCGNLTPEEIERVYMAVCFDHPELYHLPYNLGFTVVTGMFGAITTLKITNLYSDAQIRKLNQKIESVCQDLAVQLSVAQTDREKEQYICEYLIGNTVYEINNLYNQNAATVICDNKGQCSGIAKATKLLLNRFGIDAIVIDGTATVNDGKVEPHAWNIVKIGGEYFHLDVTFMIGSNLRKIKPYQLVYFNCLDEDVRKNHTWDESKAPKCSRARSTDNSGEVTGPITAISSLYELRIRLKQAVLGCERCLIFESKIQLPAEKLETFIQKCCQDVQSALGTQINMDITVYGVTVAISW